MIDQKFVDEVGTALLEHCPRVSASSDAIEQIRSKILSFDEKLGIAPPISIVLSWAASLEADLRKESDDAAAKREEFEARDRERKREREEYLSGSDADKAQAIADLKARIVRPVESQPFVPARTYTDKELAAMSSDEYAVKVLGRNTIADRNSSEGRGPVQEEAKRITRKRVMRSRKSDGSSADRQMRASLRRQVREGLI